MAFTTTRDKRADRWRTMRALLAATVTVTTLSVFCTVGSMAQVKAPAKSQFKAPSKANAKSPTDNQADQLNEKIRSPMDQVAGESRDGGLFMLLYIQLHYIRGLR